MRTRDHMIHFTNPVAVVRVREPGTARSIKSDMRPDTQAGGHLDRRRRLSIRGRRNCHRPGTIVPPATTTASSRR